jgi:hypothetical protein
VHCAAAGVGCAICIVSRAFVASSDEADGSTQHALHRTHLLCQSALIAATLRFLEAAAGRFIGPSTALL